MENKNYSFGKTRKHHSQTFATNFFESLDFLNESLINNKGIKVSKKHCTETFEESTALSPEESVKKVRKRRKKKSSSMEVEEPATKHITSIEAKQKRHKTKSTIETYDNESISTQNNENVEVLDETFTKEKRKTHKKSAFKEHDIAAQKDASLELNGRSTRHKNKLVSVECVKSVTNVGILGEECNKEKKKLPGTKSAFKELDNNNIVIQSEQNAEAADIIELINRVKRRYETKSSSMEDKTPSTKHITNSEEKRKKRKRNFNEHDYESISAQNEENFRVLGETIIKERKKRHKNKSAVEENVILAQNDTSLEFLGENAKQNSNFSEESVQNVTNGEVLGDKLIKEKKKRPKTKSFSTEFDNDNLVIKKEKNVKTAKLRKKKKKHQTELSDVAKDNDASPMENIDSILEDPVKKKKKHKRKNSVIGEDNTIISENINSIQDPAKKKKKHKRKCSDIEEDIDTVLLVNVNSIQEGHVKKKKHKRGFSEILEDDTNCLKNMDFILGDSVKRSERLKRKSHTSGQVKSNVKKDDFSSEKPSKVKKQKYKLFSADEYFALQGHENVESTNKKEKKQKSKSTNFDCSDQIHKIQSDTDECEDGPRSSRLTNHRVKDKNKLMHTRFSSEDEDDELLLQGTPLSIDISNLDLNEDPVDFEIPLLHSCEKVSQLNEEEKEALKSQGIVFKLGKFTELEDSLLRRNYNEFTKRFQINDPQILLGIGQTSRKKDVLSFLKTKHFYVRLGKGLTDRPLYNIYKRARLLFNPLNKETKLDKADVSRIRKAYSRMGSKWQAIGNIVEKSAETARQAFLWHDKSINRGKWTAEEENQLTSAIKTVSGKRRLSNTEIDGAISWEKVADLVPNRNYHQCRFHWTENLSSKFKKMSWTKKHYKKLVWILRNKFYVDDFVTVNWKDVQKCFGDISWQLLRKKWYHLTKKFRQSKNDEKVIPYKKMVDHYCITYGIKTD